MANQVTLVAAAFVLSIKALSGLAYAQESETLADLRVLAEAGDPDRVGKFPGAQP